jgi:hypothetical protein
VCSLRPSSLTVGHHTVLKRKRIDHEG